MEASDLLRKLPLSVEAEQSVLGSILVKPESFERIAGQLDAEDFYMEDHRAIFSAIQDMFLKNRTIDTVTLVNALVQGGYRDETGGIQYLTQIAQVVPSAANIRDYARIVKEKALLRRLIAACEEISEEAYSEQGDVSRVIDAAEQRIFELTQNKGSREFRHVKEILAGVYQELVDKAEHKEVDQGVRTGFSDLDRVLVQLGPADLVLVGARPGMGKTSFAMNIAVNAAKSTGKAVCIFSLEMSGEQLVNRMLSSEAMVDSHALRTGEIRPEDWQRLADASAMLAGCELLIDDTSGITVADMKAKLRRVKNLGLVVVDYLQLMQASKNIESRVQEVADISRNLKIMAKELSVPVICRAQLSRGPEQRESKKPMLSDLRDSGAIEQDADIVLFLYRDEYYKDVKGAKANVEVNTAEIIIAKNRHGALKDVKMSWNGQFTKFVTMENQGGVGGAG
ncbi:MAG: replicative DNA helicase [Clostridia bacterium]|nr:replicative DNA helicase [Clostridia bacterium]